MEKLFVSDELLKVRGRERFDCLEYDDFKSYARNETVKVGHEMYLDRDDIGNLYLSLNQGEESFTNVEDL